VSLRLLYAPLCSVLQDCIKHGLTVLLPLTIGFCYLLTKPRCWDYRRQHDWTNVAKKTVRVPDFTSCIPSPMRCWQKILHPMPPNPYYENRAHTQELIDSWYTELKISVVFLWVVASHRYFKWLPVSRVDVGNYPQQMLLIVNNNNCRMHSILVYSCFTRRLSRSHPPSKNFSYK
jgi:hypothetical protein